MQSDTENSNSSSMGQSQTPFKEIDLHPILQKLSAVLNLNILATFFMIKPPQSHLNVWVVSEPKELKNSLAQKPFFPREENFKQEPYWISFSALKQNFPWVPNLQDVNSVIVWPFSSENWQIFGLLFLREKSRTFKNSLSVFTSLKDDILSLLNQPKASSSEIAEKKLAAERKYNNRLTQYLKVIRNINQLIVREKNKHQLLQKSCILVKNLEEIRNIHIMEISQSGTVQEIYSAISIARVERLTELSFMNWIKSIIASSKNIFEIPPSIARLLEIDSKWSMTILIRYETRNLGLLLLEKEKGNIIQPHEQELFEELASDLGYALHNYELEEENKRVAQAIRFINKELGGDNSKKVLEALVANIAKQLYANLVFVGQLIHKDGIQKIRTIAVFGEGQKYENFEVELENSICAKVVAHGLYILEKKVDLPILKGAIPDLTNVQGLVGVSLKANSDETIGVLIAIRKSQISNFHIMSHVIQVFAHRASVELYRLQIEEKLQESEQRYRNIFENSPFGIYRTTLDGKILIANPALLQLLGYDSIEELKDKDIGQEIYLNQKERQAFLNKIKRNKGFVVFDAALRTKKGKTIFVKQRAKAIRDQNGQIKYIEGTVENITERREQEERIRYQNKLLEFALDAIIGTDGEYRVRFWNKSAEKLYGWKAEEVIGKKIEQIVKMEIPYEKRIEIRKIAEKQGYWRGEVIQYDRWGKKLHIEMSISDLRDQKGSVIASVGINRDITEKIKYEEALKASEESYRGLFDSVMEAIYIQAPDGTFLDVNEGAVRMYGYPKDYLVGKNPADVAAPGKNDMEKVLMHFNKALHGEPQQFEFWGKRANGEEFPKEVRLYKGTYFGQDVVIALAEDITVKKKLEEEKNKLERQVHQNQRLETIGTLAGGIAHDFNNILTPILGYAEMLKLSLKNDVQLVNKVEQIINASLRARDLIQQILTFSRQIDQQAKPILLQHIINEATHLLRASIPSTIKLKKDIDKSCLPVLADPAQIHQVLINLCTNAYHAMEKTGGELFIGLKQVHIDNATVKIHPGLKPGLYNQIIISDTGEGMEPWVLERIFEPFFTTKEVGKGTGLGLSVVHGIIKNYKGEITVNSEKGKGTTFHVYLPVADIKEVEEVGKQQDIPRGNEAILIVDDEPGVLELEEQMLEYFGYKPFGLSESTKVLDELNKNPQKYKMLITDLTMPNLTGMQLAKIVRQHFPNLPIIMITGYSEELTDDIKEKYGIQAILMKPVVASDLAITVRKVLDSKS